MKKSPPKNVRLTNYRYPDNVAHPLKIEVEASNGASDYGNKFGEPLIQGNDFFPLLPINKKIN